jgi:hypothetical protein
MSPDDDLTIPDFLRRTYVAPPVASVTPNADDAENWPPLTPIPQRPAKGVGDGTPAKPRVSRGKAGSTVPEAARRRPSFY